MRAVAVLVVATPCPLLLAAPIAIMSGLSRAAHIGVVIKGGGALERLAGGRVMLFDKTGTLTQGHPVLADVVTAGDQMDADEVLRLAASLDQVSAHVLAERHRHRRHPSRACPGDARGRPGGARLRPGGDRRHPPGEAGQGLVDRRRRPRPPWVRQVRRRADLDGSLTVFVAVDDEPAGAFLLEDAIRPDAPRMVRALREAGITRVVLVTGDRADIADMVGRIVGVDTVLADCDPADKLAAIERESANGATIMVGDGVNDAPALAAAGVGVALAARGATASSEAADVVLTVDRVDALADAILIARRSKGSPCRPSWSAWACRWSRWSSPRSGSCRPRRARSCRRSSTCWRSASPCGPCCPARSTPSRCLPRTSRPRSGCGPSTTPCCR